MHIPFEKWRVIATHPNYEISDHGRVRNIERDHILSIHNGRRGGSRVLLYRNNEQTAYQVNRLVAMMFMEEFDPTLAVKFYDGDKRNNHIDNLYQETRMSRVRMEL